MAHGQNAMIKREIDCVHHNSISVINKSSSLVGNSATVAVTAAAAQPNVSSDGSGAASHSGAGNARTGSRRIFTPQFKLQVLESYRNDSECKLNQRATARKYNIHRRQIQKWLQSEKSLRQSVANCSQNNVKHHQFHNITHHQMTISPSSAAATAIGAAAPTAAAPTTPAPPAIAQTATAVNTHTTSGAYAHHHHNNNNLHYHHHHRHSQPYKTALDPARHSVALASSPTTVRLNAAVAAPTKCMNGLPLTQPGAPTNTMGLHPAYSQTPAIKPVPLIQPHHQHQSALHQHHHPLHHSQTQQQQHENVLMSSACLPEPRAHEMLEHPPMNVAGGCYENFHRPQAQHPFGYYRGYPGAPIDLSVGPRRPMEPVEEHQKGLIYYRAPQPAKTDVKWYQVPETNNNEQKLEVKVELHSPSPCSVPSRPISTEAVDLTCRKRPNHTPDPSSPPEKILKTGFEVGTEKAEKVPAKPVKLFKPYLPDNADPDGSKETKNEQKDAIIWSIHPATASLPSPHYDMHSTHSCSSTTTTTADPNFQPPTHQNDPTYTFPLGSPHSTASSTGSKFQSSPASSLYDRITPPTSAQHPSSPVSITGGVASSSTTLHMWCPKGSPVSGYDTASNYSDSSERHPHHPQQQQHHPQHHQSVAYDQCSVPSPTSATGHTAASPIATTTAAAGRITTGYSLDVKMEPIEEGGSYYHDLTSGARYPAGRHHSEVQRWLQDHEGSHLDHHSIPHQHNRPGIAVYV